MNAPILLELGSLLINNLRLTDSTEMIDSSVLKKLFMQCGLSKRDGTEKIRSALLNVQQRLNLDRVSNNFFEVKGRLDATHLAGVVIKRDGINEILQTGNDAVSIRVRQLVGGLVRVMEAQLDKAKRYENEHRLEEAQRLGSYQVLENEVQNAMGCSTQSARGRCRQLASAKYDAMGIVDPGTPGFTTPKNAMATVASQGQLSRRSTDSVADHLTREGKFADGYLNGAIARDIQRAAPQINAATNQKSKKRVLNNAMMERVRRAKRFHIFHEDANMVGVDAEIVGSKFNAPTQANLFLNQEQDKNNFQ